MSVLSDPVRPHRRQPTKFQSLGFSRQEHWSGLPFPLHCMKVKNESEVAQSCLTLCNPMDCSPSGSSIHGICQARVLASSPAISQSLLKRMSIQSEMPSNISSSVIPFSPCLQSFPASESFPMSQLFTSGGQTLHQLEFQL